MLSLHPQRTNYALHSENFRSQAFTEHFPLCVSKMGGVLLMTDVKAWKIWKWRLVSKPLAMSTPFRLFGFRTKFVQVEDGNTPTPFIPTGCCPVTRCAETVTIDSPNGGLYVYQQGFVLYSGEDFGSDNWNEGI